MSTPTPSQNLRQRWRWLAGSILIALVLGASATVVLRKQAADELRAAGFWPGREDVWRVVHGDWHKLFRHETWHVEPTVRRVGYGGSVQIPTLDALVPALRRLGIEEIDIADCPELQNVRALKGLPALKRLRLTHCNALKNVDGLEELTALREVNLSNCRGLENVRALRGLTSLTRVNLSGCKNLSPRAVALLIAPLENATIIPP